MYINEAWLAGFIEGDGCFSVNSQQGGRYVYPKIEIHQKNTEPLKAVRDQFGFGFSPGGKIPRVQIVGRPAQAVFDKISPYLSSKRIEQAETKGFIFNGVRKPHNRSWFAGYYEAEGCIYTKTNGQTKRDGSKTLFVAMTISQYYSDETSRFCKNALGFGRVAGPYMAKGERRAYSFNLSGRQAIQTVESIQNMLSEEKRHQLKEIKNAVL